MKYHSLSLDFTGETVFVDLCLPLTELLGFSPPPLGLTLRAAGSMDGGTAGGVALRRAFLEELGFPIETVCHCHQTHTRRVFLVDRNPVKDREGDGLVCAGASSLVLTVTAADCMPVYLYDPVTGARGLCHSGWKGTGIAGDAVTLMEKDLGCRRENLVAILGPCIGSCCYRVDRERWNLFHSLWGDQGVARRGGDYILDLRGANRGLLEKAGVGTLVDWDLCTACSPLTGSFRREKDQYTRMMAYLGPARQGGAIPAILPES